ncbi:MAG: DNA replication/repair protein RecF [Myxococcales bacterium]|jgi:DNA replication and repair protein RecF|nr:DNA replication/repair protein RecF [Myxococcales bacterium]
MRLCALELKDFRNIASARLVPASQATLVIGPNGQGKTNLLEALYVLTTLRPLRASRFSELVRFGQPRARIEGRFELAGAERTIALDITAEGRAASVDGKRAQSLTDYFGGLSVVAFTPDDLAVIKGPPEGRRRLLDRAVFNRFPGHLDASRIYLRTLKQRNHLLRTGAARALVEAFDQALVQAGAEVIARRLALIAEMSDRLATSFEAIAPGDGGCALRYAPFSGALKTSELSLIAETFRETLNERIERDLERGFTSIGPHSDDVELRIGGRAARTFASQGQQRAVILAFKIAELENLRARIGVPPLLLLDDVSSELDPARNRFLMDYLRNASLQCLLTTTDERLVASAAMGQDTRAFFVERGQFRERAMGEAEEGP